MARTALLLEGMLRSLPSPSALQIPLGVRRKRARPQEEQSLQLQRQQQQQQQQQQRADSSEDGDDYEGREYGQEMEGEEQNAASAGAARAGAERGGAPSGPARRARAGEAGSASEAEAGEVGGLAVTAAEWTFVRGGPQEAASWIDVERGAHLPLLLYEDPPPEEGRFLERARRRRRLEEDAEASANAWRRLACRDAPRLGRQWAQERATRVGNARIVAQLCVREVRRRYSRAAQEASAAPQRAQRLARELVERWRGPERWRDERDQARRLQRSALEARRHEQEIQEARRQQRKLNFLLTQTELYAHFMASKLSPAAARAQSGAAATQLMEEALRTQKHQAQAAAGGGGGTALEDADDATLLREAAERAARAVNEQRARAGLGELEAAGTGAEKGEEAVESVSAARIFLGQLKEYQVKGLTWLVNLYEHGLNGILADEMGLGKTVQTIAFLAHLAEAKGIWGPFLIVSPTSTLHNWQQELARFVPALRCLPYWGTQNERRALRKEWTRQRGRLFTRDSPFHVVVTNYQLLVRDEEHFRRVRWAYLVLDEAQAIKSAASQRWRSLLQFECRNRLLLTGTPIQNNMAELWALLHFIMPTLFDSHDEFAAWFSKDIEAQSETQHQLSRLHAILSPFMLRRVKRDVEHELAQKLELTLACELTPLQRRLYAALRSQGRQSLQAALQQGQHSQAATDAQMSQLVNLVMQLRKACNHPELFRLRQPASPLFLCPPGLEPPLPRPLLLLPLPRLLFRDGMTCRPAHEAGSLQGEARRVLLRRLSPFAPDRCLRVPALAALASLLRLSPAQLSACLLDLDLIDRCVFELEERARPLQAIAEARASVSATTTASSGPPAAPPLLEARAVLERLGRLLPPEEQLLPRRVRTPPAYLPRALAVPPEPVCSDRSFLLQQRELLHEALGRRDLLLGRAARAAAAPHRDWSGALEELLGEEGLGLRRAVFVTVPRREEVLLEDSGKMQTLDHLMRRLKAEGHRVLLYSQMTKQIDLLEELMLLRGWRYVRLDGSSTLAERRDVVEDFQTRDDIFVFLLSTRAGGLGINLTAADTVVFYDSDWNPTVDAQAMDRAHRLGQTRQVTVYRLICQGTIEERILKRATHKHQIQYKVIDQIRGLVAAEGAAGSNSEGAADAMAEGPLLPTGHERGQREVARLLLDDDEMEEFLLSKLKTHRRGRKSNKDKVIIDIQKKQQKNKRRREKDQLKKLQKQEAQAAETPPPASA
jgi:DNA helicase INO80